MKNFYAVTAGAPYDHRIIAIADSKEKAERIKYLFDETESGEETDVEEYCDVMQDGSPYYQLWFSNIGIDTHIYFSGYENRDINKINKLKSGYYMVIVKAESKDHAIKIASDLVAQYKAQENGIA